MSEILDKLNRYSITLSFEDDGTPWPTAKIDGNGKYVLYDQAAAIIAAKDAEIERYREQYREAVRNAFKDSNAALSGKEKS